MDDPVVIIALVVGVLGTILGVVGLYHTTQQKKRLSEFFSQNGDGDLEKLLLKQINHSKEIEVTLEQVKDHMSLITKESKNFLTKVKISRFNPFHETGGDQSFVLILLDKKNNGVIISSLHSRDNTRVYAKEVTNGSCERKLSEEEELLLAETVTQ